LAVRRRLSVKVFVFAAGLHRHEVSVWPAVPVPHCGAT
jgi:hypothetical protein